MSSIRIAWLAVAVTGALLFGQSARAASDVSNTPSLSNHATGSVAAAIASSQASTIVSTAATGGFTAGSGGFSAGGFGSGGNGGFTPGGTGGSGGFTPGGEGTPTKPQSFDMRATGKSAGDSGAQNGIWAQGLWSNIDKTEAFLQMRGNVYNVVSGFDHRFNDRILVGLAAGYEHVDLTTKFNNGTYTDDGYTLAPYLGVTLSPQWTADLSSGYTWLNYNASRQSDTVKGSFDGARWSISSNLTGGYAFGPWRFQPKLGVMYILEKQNAYTDNTGVAEAHDTFAIGRASGGGKVGYAFDDFLPYAKLVGEWDFRKPNSVLKANGTQSEVDNGGGVGGLGVEVNKGGLTASFEVDYDSLFRQDLNVWSTVARVRWDF